VVNKSVYKFPHKTSIFLFHDLVFAKPHQVLVMLVLSLSKDWAQPVIFTN
jgi:hypothetical protein